MPWTIRFHLDEHVAHAVADGLRRLGIDVTTTTDRDAHLPPAGAMPSRVTRNGWGVIG